MFGLFKSKPELKTLIPNNYVDIHSHLMFGIDDGAQTKEDTKTIIESMKAMALTKRLPLHILHH